MTLSILHDDESTGNEIICFWNPRIHRRMCFLRYPRGHPRFPRFIRFLHGYWICVSCTVESIAVDRHWSKNIIVEAQACREIKYEDYKNLERDAEQTGLEAEIEAELEGECSECPEGLFGVMGEVGGVEYFSDPEENYCCVKRITDKRDVMKCTCYKHGATVEFPGRLPGCDLRW